MEPKTGIEISLMTWEGILRRCDDHPEVNLDVAADVMRDARAEIERLRKDLEGWQMWLAQHARVSPYVTGT